MRNVTNLKNQIGDMSLSLFFFFNVDVIMSPVDAVLLQKLLPVLIVILLSIRVYFLTSLLWFNI